MADQELSLGVIFTGVIDARLRKAMDELKLLGKTTGLTTVAKTAKDTAASVTKAKDEMSMLGKRIGQISGGFQRLTAAFKVVAAYGIAGTAVYRVVQAFRDGTKAIIEFDQALYNLQAITQATNAEVEAMGKELLRVAATTKFSAGEVADAMILLGQSGMSAAESIDAIEAVAMLATGTLSSMRETSDLLTTTLRAFTIDSSRAMEVADTFAVAVNKSKLTIDKLRIAFNYLAPVAAKAGLSFKDATAATMILANAGIRASTIGTSLRQVIARLVAPSNKLREAFITMGVDLDKLNPRTNNFADIIERLQEIVPDATKAFELFGLRGAPAVSALTTAGRQAFEEMRRAVEQVGAANKMAETQMKGLAVQAKNLADKLGVLAIAVGEGGLAGSLSILLRTLRALTDGMIWLIDNWFGQAIVGFTSFTLVTWGLITAFRYLRNVLLSLMLGATLKEVKALIIAFGSWNTMMQAFSMNLSAMTIGLTRWGRLIEIIKLQFIALWGVMKLHPVGAVIIAIGALTAGMISLARWVANADKRLEEQRYAIDRSIQKLKNYREEIETSKYSVDAYGGVIARLKRDFPKLATEIDKASKSAEGLRRILERIIEEQNKARVDNLVTSINALSKTIYQDVGAGLPSVIREFWHDSGKLLEKIDLIAPAFKGIWESGDRTEESIRGFAQSIGVSQRMLEPFVKAMKTVFDAWTEAEKASKAGKVEYESVGKIFQELIKTFDSEELAIFTKEYDAMVKEIESSNKNLERILGETDPMKDRETFLKNLRIQTADEYAIISSFLVKLAELGGKGVKTDNEVVNAKIANLGFLQKNVDKIYDQMERNEIKRTGDRRTAIEKDDKLRDEGKMRAIKEEGARHVLAMQVIEGKKTSTTEAITRARTKLVATITKEGMVDELERTVQYYRTMERLATDEKSKIEYRYQKELALSRQYAKKVQESHIFTAEQKKVILQAIDDEEKAALARKNAELIKLDYDMEKDRTELRMREAELRMNKELAKEDQNIIEIKRIRLEILDAEKDVAKKRVKVTGETLEKLKKIQGVGRKVIFDAEKEHLDAQIALWEILAKIRVESTKISYKAIERFSDEWYEKELKNLRDSGAHWREYYSLRASYLEESVDQEKATIAELDKGIIAGVKAAGLRIMSEVKTWAQIVSEGLQAVYEEFRKTISDSIYNILKGDFDNIEDLWRNLSDAILRIWADMLSEMITKWMTTQAALGVAKLTATAMGSYAGAGTYDVQPGSPQWHHEGGVVGREGRVRPLPRFHTGTLAANEVTAVLKKGEGVFTPGQMKALGKGMESKEEQQKVAPQVNINIMTPDTKTMAEWVRNNRNLLASATTESIKDGNRPLIGSLRRAMRRG